MSFSNHIYHDSRYKNNIKRHVPSLTAEIHKHGSNGLKNSHAIALPPSNEFGGEIRVKPKSSLNSANLISGGGQIDYELKPPGYTKKVKLELNITIDAAASNPVQLNAYYLIDRIEVHTTEGNILQTIYADNLYLEKLHQTYEQHERQRRAENLGSDYDPLAAIAAGTTSDFVLHIPCFIDGSHPKLNTVDSDILFRFFFSSKGVASGAATDVIVNQADLLVETQQLSGELENLELKRKASIKQCFRFLSPVRAASKTIANMVGSSHYDIRLSSLNALCAYIVFVIRPAPSTAANRLTFQTIESFELLDQNMQVVGQKTNNVMARDYLTQRGGFNGFIFTQKAGIYVIPFCADVETSRNGGQTGFYAFSSDEHIRIYTPSGWVTGNYIVDVYGYEIQMFEINKGRLSVMK